MRRFLLAMPLLLVFGLLFVELPNTSSGTSNASISTQTNSSTTAATSPSTQASASDAIAPQSVSKSKDPVSQASKTQIPGKKIKGHEEDDENKNEGEDD
jgi:hypothetical protein